MEVPELLLKSIWYCNKLEERPFFRRSFQKTAVLILTMLCQVLQLALSVLATQEMGRNIMKSKFGPGWGIIYKGKQQWEYHGRKITDFDTARTVAFNLFDELHESRHLEQPYWDGDRWIYV